MGLIRICSKQPALCKGERANFKAEHLKALLLDAGLVEHIYIPCNLGQVIHLFPFDIAACQKLLDVFLQSRL